ncbi:hypothetical protein DN062_04635 [Nitrincola tibetensis]|uniref:Glycosyltransferase 2-like domain-containing protein n=1 Tax=Nitrincola tibetensis TaxID=2219697 RepID=A0A364NPG4_9GAMM|nr:glycosyltransferase family 2 protein [Nitrincola tibetensis]RAU18775.1 hypothetical protein DN062_04635 [Nitrincola tibetensis]
MTAISVIIPVFNAAQYIEETLFSLMEQTWQDFEIICVDDGSTDASLAQLEAVKTKEPRLRILTQANAGPAIARQAGLGIAQGEYVYFMDSDDFLHSDTLNRLYGLAVAHQADWICHRLSYVAKDHPIQSIYADVKASPAKVIEGTKGILSKKISIVSCGKLYRRSVFDDFQFPELSFAEDYYCTSLLALKAEKIIYIRDKLYFYRQHDASLTGSLTQAKVASIFEASNLLFTTLEKTQARKSATLRLKNYTARYQFYPALSVLLRRQNLDDLAHFRDCWTQQAHISLKNLTWIKRWILSNVLRGQFLKAINIFQRYEKWKV